MRKEEQRIRNWGGKQFANHKIVISLSIIALISINFSQVACTTSRRHYNSPSPAAIVRQQQSASRLFKTNPNNDQQQRPMQSEEYESNEKLEDQESSTRATGIENEKVIPSKETNGNSQVVYVNLARVVSDDKNSTRVISTQPQLIKTESQIACGETNRNGRPSSESAATNDNETLLNRIVGGNKAEPGEFPYQVRLNIRSRRGSSLCGGVIIDKRHILTAAHCMTTW